jgi:hypothetical protein
MLTPFWTIIASALSIGGLWFLWGTINYEWFGYDYWCVGLSGLMLSVFVVLVDSMDIIVNLK